MKKFLKTFFISVALLALITVSGFAIFKAVYTPSHLREDGDAIEDIIFELPDDEVIDLPDETEVIEKTEDELWVETLEASDRVNILLLGTDGERADTLIMLSYSKKEKDVTMITVPRDTKNVIEGRIYSGQDKINAVYGFGDGEGGSENQKEAVQKLLGVPIHYFIKVSYNGLKAVVDTIGGVEVYVHRNMYYDDIYAVPELHIHLSEGSQVLNGQKSVEYIRWRKNNDGSGDSDTARTKRQQDFVIKVVKKSFGLDILKVIGLCYDYVYTDMTEADILFYGTELIGFDFADINKLALPGEADMYYFYQDLIATKLMMQELYGFK